MSVDRAASPTLSQLDRQAEIDALDELPTPTLPVEADAPASHDKTKKRLRRTLSISNLARTFIDADAEVSGEDSGDEAEPERTAEDDAFIVPDDQPILSPQASQAPASQVPVYDLTMDEPEEPRAPSAKRSAPEPEQSRMLTDEELAEAEAAAEPPASQRRAEPAPSSEPAQPRVDETPAAAAAAEEPEAMDDEDPSVEPRNKSATYMRWCFTWYPEESDYRPAALPKDSSMVYMIYQEELCPKTGRPHLQGYCRFSQKKRWQQTLNLLSEMGMSQATLTVRAAKKCELACIRYCSKQKTRRPGTKPVELGSRKEEAGQQGHRSDLDRVVERIQAGATYEALVEEEPKAIIKYGKGIKEVIAVKLQSKWEYTWRKEIKTCVIWGKTGTGKSYRVRDLEKQNLYVVKKGRDPWGRYRQQEAILFDEFGMGQDWDINAMKTYLEEYPCQLDCRYADSWAAWTRVYIVSNDPPNTWYMMAPKNDLEAFWRRITTVQFINKRRDAADFNEEIDELVQPKPM